MSGQDEAGPYYTDETPTYSGTSGATVIRVTRSPTDPVPIGIAYGTWSPINKKFSYILYVNGVKLAGYWIVQDGRFEPELQ